MVINQNGQPLYTSIGMCWFFITKKDALNYIHELNEAQNKLISDFHTKFGHEDASGHLKPEVHLTDIRALVEACLQAADETQDTTNATPQQ
jgi:hypothetical protein